ncbi:hypothetical protein HYFRA_00002091 [Hymenoscyphus fraxineus]|uniref:FAD dependent oxidoreductase domain-containing protein n=1 Tax=Hymenoscyphus fraxineus TaxID=746836 RepID=A0A9N9KL35_9HELO|nr:hypothetical protein HYFRA_00002091 [Hymenoscyphus fraxineus]
MGGATAPLTGLPHTNPTKSYWQRNPHRIADLRSTASLPTYSKYIIIGSGITGASIAYKLLGQEPAASIVLLEARQAASGATGRNGGHCRPGDYREFSAHVERFGLEDALRMEKLEADNIKLLTNFIREHGIECDLNEVESVEMFTDEKPFKYVLGVLEARKKVAEMRKEAPVLREYRIWSAEETEKELLTPNGVGAVSLVGGYQLQPYLVACGILELAIEKGLNLQTNTPVTKISKLSDDNESNGWKVHTDRGDVIADKVILATNAYSGALYPDLAEFIQPTKRQMCVVRPGSKIIDTGALPRTGVWETSDSSDYYQQRYKGSLGEGDLVLGGSLRASSIDDSSILPEITEYFAHRLPVRFYGRENWGEDGEIIQEWSGIMGYTSDRRPIIGEAPGQNGLWVCVGFNGHGMALTFQSAEALVKILDGEEKEVDKWLPSCYKIQRLLKSGL